MNDDLRDLYQDLILDHGKRPRNFRVIPTANHEALGHNPLCGDKISLYVSTDDKGVIQDAAFQGSGCAISVASASMMTEMLKGKTVGQAETLFSDFHQVVTEGKANHAAELSKLGKLSVLTGVCEYPARVKCATLAWHTMHNALSNQLSEIVATTDDEYE